MCLLPFLWVLFVLLCGCYALCRMYVVRDASRDKPFELEMGWLCEESEWKYTAVPSDLV